MRNSLLALIVFLRFAVSAQTPDWGWLRTGSGTGDEQFSHLVTDAQGNVYAGGTFNSASVAISNSVLTNSGANTRDVLLAKYNKAGDLLWLLKVGAAGDELIRGLASDPSGNLLVTGNFDSPSLTIGNNILSNTSGSSDIFLVKLNPSGTPLWSFAFGGNLLEEAAGVCCDNSGNILLAGSFRSLSLSFGNVGVINSGGADAFLTKFSPAGLALWARQIGGSADEWMQAVTTDSNTSVYVGGDFNSAVLSTYGFTCQGQSDLFIGRYDLATGNFLGARQIGGTQSDNLQALKATASSELFIAGSFASPVLNLGALTLNLGSTRDLLLMKTTATLQASWANRYSGNSGSNFTTLQTDGSSLIASGSFNTAGLSLGTLSFTNAGTFYKGFMAQFNSTGAAVWGLQTNGNADQKLLATVADNSGSYFVSGYFSGLLSVGGQSINSSGLQDAVLGRLCTLPGTPVLAGPSVICRGAAVTLSANPVAGISVHWYASSLAVTPVLSGTNLWTVTAPGTYYARAQSTITGCYSAARSVLTLTQPPAPIVSVSGKTLSSSASASYQWLRCDRDSVMTSATSPAYTLAFTGYFSVATVVNGCRDTSACVFYSVNAVTGTITVPGDTIKVTTGLEELRDDVDWTLRPNPTNGFVLLKTSRPVEFELVSVTGQVLRQWRVEQGETELNWSDLTAGCYLLRAKETKKIKYVLRLP